MSKYEIEESPIWADVRDIMSSSSKPVRFEYRGMVHTEKEDFPVIKILTEDIIRDYAGTIGDQVRIEFKLALGDYMIRLYPYRNNLEFTIKKTILQENTTTKVPDSIISTRRYKAVFSMEENPPVNTSDIDRYDIETLNHSNIVDVKLQLLDRSLEPLRIKTTGGIFRDVTQSQIIVNILSGESNKVLVDGRPSIDGIDVVEPDNSERIKHVNIPHGTHITAVPSYLQEKNNGVYNTAVGTYLQTFNEKKIWFVYPLFKLNRFDSNVDKAIIYMLPSEKYISIDRTYNKEGNILNILATANKQYKDNSETSFMNQGSGFRMADARSFMKKPAILNGSSAEASRVNLMHEVAVKDRNDGLNYAPLLPGGPSANPFKEYSKIAARSKGRFNFVWENANPDLLYPGMPCKVVYVEDGTMVELKGIIHHVHAFTSVQGQNALASNLYKNLCAVGIVCEQKQMSREVPITQTAGVF